MGDESLAADHGKVVAMPADVAHMKIARQAGS